MVKASAYDVGDPSSIPGSGRSPGEGNGNPLQYSCLENPMDKGAWWATVPGVAKSRTGLSDFTSLLCVSSCTTSRGKAINHLHFHMKLYCKSFLPIGFPQQQKILCPGERSCLTGFFSFFPFPKTIKGMYRS